MGWFDEQIRSRVRADEDGLARAFQGVSSAVTGREALFDARDGGAKEADAVGAILRYYGARAGEAPSELTDPDKRMEALLRPTGIMRRAVRLEGAWYRDTVGPMLGTTRAGEPVALIPGRRGGYTYTDWRSGRRVRVDARIAADVLPDAVCFYRPLPLRPLAPSDLWRYMARLLSPGDAVYLALAALLATLTGMLTPYANRLLFGVVIPQGLAGLIAPIACLLACAAASAALIDAVRSLLTARIGQKIRVAVEAAVMMRVLSLPAPFFKRFSAGELANRAFAVNELSDIAVQALLSVGLSGAFSLAYVVQIARYAPTLTATALCAIAATVIVSCLAVAAQTRAVRARMEAGARQSGLVYQLFSGVQKIRLSGAENRAFSQWAARYQEGARAQYAPPLFVRLAPALTLAVSLAGMIALYARAGVSGVSAADYLAFSAAYGLMFGAVSRLTSVVQPLSRVRPILRMLEPILAETPEINAAKRMPAGLSGMIEMSGVSFRYAPGLPLVLDDLSLSVKPGQYVAIVGKTGCGKSTLMRLLLGFERPDKGAIYYDGRDINALDLPSLRRNIGSVMQNGKLFQGDIYSNIVISAPWLTLDDAWKAAEMAGIAQDIRAMPMGMHTWISEGSGGVSGGQRQRLMIARAIAPRPKILFFDEATSALDNATQRVVTQSLDALKCTRVVIAHRLSTIRTCDRIVVLDGGRIAQDGTYEELAGQPGVFRELIERQRLDGETDA